MTLAAELAWVKLAAETALLRRVSVGAGDPRAPAIAYLREPAARARLHHGTLRPDGSHRQPLLALANELAAARASIVENSELPLASLAARIKLSSGEQQLLSIAVAYQLDLDVRELVHALSPRRRPALWAEAVLDIALVLDEESRLTSHQLIAALDRDSNMLGAGLLVVDGTGLAANLTVPARIIAWLNGDHRLSTDAAVLAHLHPASDLPLVALAPAVLTAIDALTTRLATTTSPLQIVVRGPRGSGRRAVAHRIARASHRPLFVIEVRRLIRTSSPALHLTELLAESRLHQAQVLLLDAEALRGPSGELAITVEQVLRAHPDHLIIAIPSAGTLDLERNVVELSLGRATLGEREAAWQTTLAAYPVADQASLSAELAARYVLGPGAIAEVAAVAAAAADAAGTPLDGTDLESAATSRLSLRLGAFGTVISRKARFSELVLPDDTVDTLHDMVAMVAGRAQILERWDYQRHLGIARGVSALFSGDPGTGKTMAASVLASAMGLELVRIDLAAVVSKYVGETEKNLGAIFDEAQDAHAMLLFDEADGLFAKRTEVKSAQDRFANLEVGYLLQRMEGFDGVSVLTTNLESSLDTALLRRLNFRIRFPTPEPEERKRLWQQLVPPAALQSHASQLDIDSLADAFAMSGGYIKNAIVRAAVVASRAGRQVTIDDLWTGAHAEYAEMGKVTSSLQRPR